jgi:phosphoinositide-3-kinase regulatory subunit 4
LFSKIPFFFFSCILAELFTEQPLFTLTQMLDYRMNGYDPMPIVNKIVDVDIRVKILIFRKI